jgi:hypothetical protein
MNESLYENLLQVVVAQIKRDLVDNDCEALFELLMSTSEENLINYLVEEDQIKFKQNI